MSQVQRLLPAAVFCVWGRSGCGGAWEGKIYVKVSPKGASPVGTSWDIPHIEVRLAVFVVNLGGNIFVKVSPKGVAPWDIPHIFSGARG